VGTQVSGQVKKLRVEIGSRRRRRDDLLAEIDPGGLPGASVDGDRAQLQQPAGAARRPAGAAGTLAELQLTRQQNLAKRRTPRRPRRCRAPRPRRAIGHRRRSNSLQARRCSRRESTLRGDEASLGYTRILRADRPARWSRRTAKEGQTLNANQQAPIVLRIADLSTMTVQAQVSEADVSKLRVGMEVYFTTLGGDRSGAGTQQAAPDSTPTPTAVNNVVLYDALFDVANPNRHADDADDGAGVLRGRQRARTRCWCRSPALRPVRGGGRRGGEGRKRGASPPVLPKARRCRARPAGSEAAQIHGRRRPASPLVSRIRSSARAPKVSAHAKSARRASRQRVSAADPRAGLRQRPRAEYVVVGRRRQRRRSARSRAGTQCTGSPRRCFRDRVPGEQVVVGTRQQNVPQRPAAGAQGAPKMTPTHMSAAPSAAPPAGEPLIRTDEAVTKTYRSGELAVSRCCTACQPGDLTPASSSPSWAPRARASPR
jgi:macrolide-specific efflux system membrane fusion protein